PGADAPAAGRPGRSAGRSAADAGRRHARAGGAPMNGVAAPQIVVLGAGFGALSTVRRLRQPGCTAPITLVAPRAELHYLPGIIWIPSGLRTRADLVVPLDNFFARMNVRHHLASVTGLSDDGRVVHTSAGELANEALVIAS